MSPPIFIDGPRPIGDERDSMEVRIPGPGAARVQRVVPATVEKPSPGIDATTGIDWSKRTAAEAVAAGVTVKVLCRDGWAVPR